MSFGLTSWVGWGALALALASVGCGGFETVDLEVLAEPSTPVVVTDTYIELEQGVALAVRAYPLDGDQPDDVMDDCTTVVLESDDPSIMDVERGFFDEEGLDEDEIREELRDWNFLFAASSPGDTQINVIIDGELAMTIPARVVVPGLAP